jgi:hypothetical protein
VGAVCGRRGGGWICAGAVVGGCRDGGWTWAGAFAGGGGWI